MSTACELSVEEDYRDLLGIAESRNWPIQRISQTKFRIELPAKDSSRFAMSVDCSGFMEIPPAFHWCDPNPDSVSLDRPEHTPKGSGYLHGSGVICAPWNRLAYKECDSRGPHGDWQLANWLENPKTGQTTTLSAMILRVFHELNGPNFHGRKVNR